MKKEPLLLSFCNQKGGIGKSTFTIMAANWLHYSNGYRIAVIDCDYPQHSVYELRTREIEALSGDDRFKMLMMRQFAKTQKKAYPVLRSNAEKALTDAETFLRDASETYDAVFFDLPGTINTKGVLTLIASLDYLFVPMKADRLVMQSTLNFAKTVHENFVKNEDIRTSEIYLLWNLADRRDREILYDQYESLFRKMDLKCLSTRIPMRSKFQREFTDTDGAVSRSTLFVPQPRFLRESRFGDLMSEICSLIELRGDGEKK